MAKETGIAFMPALVAAIIRAKKSETRRLLGQHLIINQEPERYKSHGLDENGAALFEDLRPDITPWISPIPCPFGKEGDLLWVRETHYRYGHWEKNGITKKGAQKWRFVAADNDVRYETNAAGKKTAPSSYFSRPQPKRRPPEANFWYKRNARFMPKSLARLWLRLESVKVEPIQDITPLAVSREGIQQFAKDKGQTYKYGLCDYDGEPGGVDVGWKWAEWETTPEAAFRKLWESVHGPGSWGPSWVWVVNFIPYMEKLKP